MTAIEPLPEGNCSACGHVRHVAKCADCDQYHCRFCLLDQLTPYQCRKCFKRLARTQRGSTRRELFYQAESVTVRRTRPTTNDTPFCYAVEAVHVRSGIVSRSLEQDLDQAIHRALRQFRADVMHGQANTG